LHPDTKNLYPPMKAPANAEGVIQWFRETSARLPDLRLEVVRWAPCGDHVLIEWSATASIGGKPFTWQGVDRFTLKGDRCIEGRVYYDTQLLRETIATASTSPKVQ
jgi:ketosteroid isomerase-like protein